ncbi:MmcQ/YjbR family DNA-binding protein [Dactylosporangium sp. CA-152071]|uniref:MmcQ/YjbR family DNA-binding protein n=1 Tax=Dactylosporangium sp. CA-152071 TaxID=3239933 RepID=UPI003D8D2405
MGSVDEVRAVALSLPRTTEHLIRDRVKFRVGSIVYLALSQDETTLGFAFPKEERDALVATDPGRFFLPQLSDLRFNWACGHLAELGGEELRDLIVDAWRMVVPKRVYAAWHQSLS